MMTNVLYVSFDVEADGNNPCQHNMVQWGGAIFDPRSNSMIDSLCVDIKPRPDVKPDPSVIKTFWNEKLPGQYDRICREGLDHVEAMRVIGEWVRRYVVQGYTLKFLASPANFDWMFFKIYYELYYRSSVPEAADIGFACISVDNMLRSYGLINGFSYGELEKHLSQGVRHNHNACQDAVGQGIVYMKLRALLDHKVEPFIRGVENFSN